MSELVSIATFHDSSEAHVACGFLNANGVDAILGDAETLSNLPLHQIALGGYRMLVPREQAHVARTLLRSVESEGQKEAGYKVEGIRCTRCGGEKFIWEKLKIIPSLLLLFVGAPAHLNSKRLRCTNCGAITDQQAEQAE